MAQTKREVWEAAQAAGLDGFISAVSRAFPDAIDGVAISARGIGVFTTDDRLLHKPIRVIPGVGIDAKESKRIRDEFANKSNMKYKGGKK